MVNNQALYTIMHFADRKKQFTNWLSDGNDIIYGAEIMIRVVSNSVVLHKNLYNSLHRESWMSGDFGHRLYEPWSIFYVLHFLIKFT